MFIVTGGTSGLGLSVADRLRSSGNKVLTISRREFDDPLHYACDISSYDSLKLISRDIARDHGGKISGLINCAGVASMNLAIMTPPNITEKIIKINLLGTIFSSQIFSPFLIKNKGGSIINFSTIAVAIGLTGESVYSASKAGVESFTRVLASELSSFDIRCNCIAPGPIRTNLLKGLNNAQIDNIISRQIIKREMQPDSISDVVESLISPGLRTITGQVIHIGGV